MMESQRECRDAQVQYDMVRMSKRRCEGANVYHM